MSQSNQTLVDVIFENIPIAYDDTKSAREYIEEAIPAISELIESCIPEEKKPTLSAFKAVPKSQMAEARLNYAYNQALKDVRNRLREVMGE